MIGYQQRLKGAPCAGTAFGKGEVLFKDVVLVQDAEEGDALAVNR